MECDHIVPLAHQGLEILQFLKTKTDASRYVFPCPRVPNGSILLSNAAKLVAPCSMEYEKEEICAHGLRCMDFTLLHELGWSNDLIKKQLGTR